MITSVTLLGLAALAVLAVRTRAPQLQPIPVRVRSRR